MDFEASDKPNFCVGDDNGNLLVSCEDFDYDIPLSQMIPSLGTCSSKCDGSVKKRDFEFPNNNSLHISVKKLKVSPYHDHGKDEGGIPLAKKSTDKSFSSLNKDLTLLEKLFEECIRQQKVEEKRLQSIKRDIQKCCKELENKKKQVSFVRRVDEACEKVQGKIEECIKDFVVKERELCLIEDLIGERKQELKTKESELNQVKGNISKEIELCQVIDKDREKKEDELKALSQKIAESTLELNAKEIELDAMNKLIGGQAEKLESERNKLLKVTSEKENGHAQMKELDSMKKQLEDQVKELELKEKQCEERVEDLESKEKHFEKRVKELMSREKQLEGHMKEFHEAHKKMQGKIEECINDFVVKEGQLYLMEDLIGERNQDLKTKEIELIQVQGNISMEKHYKGRAEELESQEKHLEGRVKVLESKEKQLERRWKELESKENEFKEKVEELNLKEKQFDGKIKDLESKLNKFDGQVKEPESRKKYTDEEKESDFVEMLIREKKFVGAVRFRGAYNLADKNQLVHLLREHALNAKQICESSCKKTNSVEIKDKARDEEIASLGTVLQCISDYNLQSEVLLEKDIGYRILELQAHKGN